MTARVREIPLAGPQHIAGWKPDKPDHRDLAMAEPPLTIKIPDEVDLRPQGPPIRDQGQLGSCVANSTLEADGFLYTRSGHPDPMLSRLDLYLKARTLEGTPASEDSGCQIRDAMKAMATQGACLEASWPYDVSKFADSPPPITAGEAAQHKILFYYRLPSHRACLASLAQGFPFVFGIPVPENMMSARCAQTGVVQFPSPTEGFEGGHAIMAIGYSFTRAAYIVQNSWGTTWGDRGYLYLPFRFFTDGLATDRWTIRRELQPELAA